MVKITLTLDVPDEETLFNETWVGKTINAIILTSKCISWESEVIRMKIELYTIAQVAEIFAAKEKDTRNGSKYALDFLDDVFNPLGMNAKEYIEYIRLRESIVFAVAMGYWQGRNQDDAD